MCTHCIQHMHLHMQIVQYSEKTINYCSTVPSVEHTWEHTHPLNTSTWKRFHLWRWIITLQARNNFYCIPLLEKKNKNKTHKPWTSKREQQRRLCFCTHFAFPPTKAANVHGDLFERMCASPSWYSTGHFSGPATVKHKRISLLLAAYLFDLWPCDAARVRWGRSDMEASNLQRYTLKGFSVWDLEIFFFFILDCRPLYPPSPERAGDLQWPASTLYTNPAIFFFFS